jgi:hypothetical protein
MAIERALTMRSGMKKKPSQKKGWFAVKVEIANDMDVGLAECGRLDPAKVRRKKIRGWVNPNATFITRLVLPRALVKELGLPFRQELTKIQLANGRWTYRKRVEAVRLFLQDRDGVFNAVVEPRHGDTLIGSFVLEDLDFVVDCNHTCLVPRDPEDFTSAE